MADFRGGGSARGLDPSPFSAEIYHQILIQVTLKISDPKHLNSFFFFAIFEGWTPSPLSKFLDPPLNIFLLEYDWETCNIHCDIDRNVGHWSEAFCFGHHFL